MAPRHPDAFEGQFATAEAWRMCVDDVVDVNRYMALKGGLVGWLSSGYAEWEDPERALGLPTSVEVLQGLAELWPSLDPLPTEVAFHFAFALIAWPGREAISASAARLAPTMPLPKGVFASHRPNERLLSWLHTVARADPLLAFKVGAEAALRGIVAHDAQLRVAFEVPRGEKAN